MTGHVARLVTWPHNCCYVIGYITRENTKLFDEALEKGATTSLNSNVGKDMKNPKQLITMIWKSFNRACLSVHP